MTTNFRGTPGDWFLDEGWIDHHISISSDSHGSIALVLSDMEEDYTCSDSIRSAKRAQLKANAQAMVSAPKLIKALENALEWIDAVPSDMSLPAMPGFCRDEVDSLIKYVKGETDETV